MLVWMPTSVREYVRSWIHAFMPKFYVSTYFFDNHLNKIISMA